MTKIEIDLKDWIPNAAACGMLAIDARTLDRWVADGRIIRRSRPRPGKRPEAVVSPADVERILADRATAPTMKATEKRPEVSALLSKVPAALEAIAAALAPRDSEPLRMLTIAEAAKLTGLSRGYIRRAIDAGALGAHRADLTEFRGARS